MSNWVEDPEDKTVVIVLGIVVLICLLAIGFINMNPGLFQAS
jgi:hypothetical protein